jgi:hypothetical protein
MRRLLPALVLLLGLGCEDATEDDAADATARPSPGADGAPAGPPAISS